MTSRQPSPWFPNLRRSDRSVASRQRVVVDRMRDALAGSDAAALGRVIHSDATLLIDSGGRAGVPGAPVLRRETVATSLVDLLGGHTGTSGAAVAVNGSPGLALRSHGRVIAVIAMRIRGTRAAEIWVVMNPGKLRRWNGD